MEEVDNIIMHSLRQVGCSFDDDCHLANFTAESLVHAVATCLQEIQPDTTKRLPRALPANLAQRFAVATTLAEACSSCGYRSGDIGYHTFLYPNAVDVRRLLMFLVEHLPKERSATSEDADGPVDALTQLRHKVKRKLQQQLRAPWVPQYCRTVGNWRHDGCSSQHIDFMPQLNLNVPRANETSQEVQAYLKHQAPSIFQQTKGRDCDLISSVLHKNALDRHIQDYPPSEFIRLPSPRNISMSSVIKKPIPAPRKATVADTASTVATIETTASTPLERLSETVNTLKIDYDALIQQNRTITNTIHKLRTRQSDLQASREPLRNEMKIHERSNVVLENPQENIAKLKSLVITIQERRKILEEQWHSYRRPLLQQAEELRNSKQTRHVQNVIELRAQVSQLEQELRVKTTRHSNLAEELKNASLDAAPRKEYTQRIHEFIGNIRKQRIDIFKVLEDTRELQKRINTVGAQLQRQFSYTDDLLFQSAKHDVHAKKAYKLLATLHATCNDLVELVSQTGQLTKSIRELEVQIDRERLKNIAASLEQITADISNFENIIADVKTRIQKEENVLSKA